MGDFLDAAAAIALAGDDDGAALPEVRGGNGAAAQGARDAPAETQEATNPVPYPHPYLVTPSFRKGSEKRSREIEPLQAKEKM
jgi:hypothetical protein